MSLIAHKLENVWLGPTLIYIGRTTRVDKSFTNAGAKCHQRWYIYILLEVFTLGRLSVVVPVVGKEWDDARCPAKVKLL